MIKKLLHTNEAALVIILVFICLFFAIATPYFFTADNLFLVSGQMVELGLLSIGMAVSLISGGFDLSIGSMGSLATILLGIFIGNKGMNMWLAMLIVLAITLFIGLVNGFLCGILKLEPFMATMGMQGLLAGIALGVARSEVYQIKNPEYFFGKLKVFDIIPFQFIIYLAAIVVTIIIMNYSRWGRQIYMLGSAKNAAKYAGINIKKNTFMVYLYSAFMSFLAAVVISSRLECGRTNLLESQVLQAVTASVFGGVSVAGGQGNILGCVLGVIIFSVISNGLNLVGISQYVKQIVVGAVLIGVLAYRMMRSKNSR